MDVVTVANEATVVSWRSQPVLAVAEDDPAVAIDSCDGCFVKAGRIDVGTPKSPWCRNRVPKRSATKVSFDLTQALDTKCNNGQCFTFICQC